MKPTHVMPVLALAALLPLQAMAAPASPLASAVVAGGASAQGVRYDGVVEAVRQSVVAAQVSGAVMALHVQAGDRVRAGQVLVRLDARAAAQHSAAGAAQAEAARTAQELAARDFQRQQRLHEQRYISDAALERAQAQYRASAAQFTAQLAQASAARIDADLSVIRAPYTGIVAQVPVMRGDMAMPGTPLLTLYDPGALRITAPVPHSALASLRTGALARVELPGADGASAWIENVRIEVLPAFDPATHTGQVRVSLPAGARTAPGAFARLWLPARTGEARLFVPASALVKRAELDALYVLDAQGKPVLRQVRAGERNGARVEVLSGVRAGERVALDPQAAARVAQ